MKPVLATVAVGCLAVGALRFVRTSSLAGWLVVSALGMVLALFMAQYLYSDILARGFPDPAPTCEKSWAAAEPRYPLS